MSWHYGNHKIGILYVLIAMMKIILYYGILTDRGVHCSPLDTGYLL